MAHFERWTGIKSEEQPLVLKCVFYIVLIGIVKIWLDIIPRSLFLKHYTLSKLPYVYGASALGLLMLGLVYSLIERRFTFSKILKLFSYTLTLSFFLIWLGVLFNFGHWLYLVAMTVGQVANGLFQVQVWGMFNNLLTLDQAKRMLAILGLSHTSAYILGSLLVPLLNYVIGINNVLLATTLCMAGATMVLTFILRQSRARFSPSQHKHSEIKKKYKTWIKKSYHLDIFIFCFFGFVTFVIVDFLFNAVSKNEIQNEIKLADFFGYFSAVIYGVQLLMYAFVSRFFIQNFGVRAGLLARFYLIGIITLTLVIAPLNYVFLLCVFLKLIDETFRGSIYRQAYLLLFFPLGPQRGSEFYNITQLFASPLAMLFASSLMWMIWKDQKIGLFLSILFLSATIAINILVGFLLRKGYIKQLKKTIGNRTPQIIPKLYDSSWAEIILTRIAQGYPDEVVYCLDLLQNTDKNLFEKGLFICLQSPDSLVRYHAYQKLRTFELPSSIPLLEQRFRSELDPLYKAEAFQAMLFQSPDPSQKLQAYLDDAQLIDLAVVAVLQRAQELNNDKTAIKQQSLPPLLIEKALSKLNTLGTSPVQNDRLRAAQILAQLDNHQVRHLEAESTLLEKLLYDEDSQVIEAAIRAASVFYEDKFYKILIDYLDIPAFQPNVMSVLLKAHDNALPFLEKALKEAWAKGFTKQSKLLIICLGHIKDPHAITILLHYLKKVEDRTLRNHLIQSLEIAKFHTEQSSDIDPFLYDELEHLKWLMHFRHVLKNTKEPANLYEALDRECSFSKKQIFVFLGFLYPKEVIHNIFVNLEQTGNLDKSSYAFELLENILNKHHKKSVLPAIQLIFEKKFMPEYTDDMVRVIQEILLLPTYKVTSLVKALALYTIDLIHLKQLVPLVENMPEERDFLVRETRSWLLTKFQIKKAEN